MLWIVVGLIVLTFGVTVFAAVRLRGARRAVERCREWPEVTGRVIALSIREVSVEDAGTEYVPVVQYRYVAGDTQYESEQLAIGVRRYSRRGSAERRLARYSAGRPVQVHVDPENPSSAVLECRAPFVAVLWAALVVIWVVMIGGLGLLLLTPGVAGPEPVLRLW